MHSCGIRRLIGPATRRGAVTLCRILDIAGRRQNVSGQRGFVVGLVVVSSWVVSPKRRVGDMYM